MEYTIKMLADLAGVSNRTLRYYDEINLLKPLYINSSGYRVYGENEVNKLQQISFFKALGFDLKSIINLMDSGDFDRKAAFEEHLLNLKVKRDQIDLLINTIEKTIRHEKGEITMTNKEKFEGLKRQDIEQNEKTYGKEIREKYGDETINASNAKYQDMSQNEYNRMKDLNDAICSRLEKAVESGLLPDSPEAGEIFAMHRDMLMLSLPNYSKEIHKGIAELYISDERFTEYYDKNVRGSAALLTNIVNHWLTKA